MTTASRQYDAWAHFYDIVWRRYADRTLDALLDRIDLNVGDRILDVGCGTGILEEKLLRQDRDRIIVGVDASSRMLEHAHEKAGSAPNASFERADACDLPFPDASFDVVVSASTLHYFDNPTAALREMRRVLRRNGRLFVLDWSCDFTIMRLRDAILRAIDPAHVRTYSSTELRRLFRDAGLDVLRFETFQSGTYGLAFAAASPTK